MLLPPRPIRLIVPSAVWIKAPSKSMPAKSPATPLAALLAVRLIDPFVVWTVVVAALRWISMERTASAVMAPAFTVETVTSLLMIRSVPALRSIAPLPPVAVTLAEMVRSSSLPPSSVAVSVMSPPSLLAIAALTVRGLLATRIMLSLLVSLATASVIVLPDSPSTVPTTR